MNATTFLDKWLELCGTGTNMSREFMRDVDALCEARVEFGRQLATNPTMNAARNEMRAELGVDASPPATSCDACAGVRFTDGKSCEACS